MSNEFVAELGHQFDLGEQQRDILAFANVSDYAGLYSLVTTYPSLAQQGLNLAQLSGTALRQLGSVSATARSFARARPKRHAGAHRPGHQPNVPMPIARARGGRGKTAIALNTIDRTTDLPSWPVKDQGERGTCVAFAVAAVLEHCHAKSALSLSEQFLYWAAKTKGGDQFPTVDGTTLECAHRAVIGHGACEEGHWRYDPRFNPNSITHDPPPKDALTDASKRCCTGSHVSTSAGAALLSALTRGKVAALTLPVFHDASDPDLNNWNTFNAEHYGEIIDPAPSALATFGHAVCVTGYVPDSDTASGGGRFIVRNSWGTGWGTNPRRTPARPGYGFVTARHVDLYAWEVYSPP
jgi:hypothetical protein